MPVRAERDYENLPGIPILSATAARRYRNRRWLSLQGSNAQLA
jgi:hypothetical protein